MDPDPEIRIPNTDFYTIAGLDYLESVEGVFVGGSEQVCRHRLKAHCLSSVDKPATS
jgi:hypothetical protein